MNVIGNKILATLVDHLLPALFSRLRIRAAEELTEKNLKLLLGERPGLVPLTGTLNANLRLITEFHLMEVLLLRLQENVCHTLFNFATLIAEIGETLVDLLDALIELTILADFGEEFGLRHGVRCLSSIEDYPFSRQANVVRRRGCGPFAGGLQQGTSS